MDGKKIILFIVTISVIIIILTWIFGQRFIEKQQVDESRIEVIDGNLT